MGNVILCVPNFSESKNEAILSALERAVLSVDGALLLGWESDDDHNRSVFTVAGPAKAVQEAAVRAVIIASERIDLTRHTGAHPRIGAADVIPFVPIEGPIEECVETARSAAAEIWSRAKVPSYLYEFAALKPERRNLEAIRKIGFESLRDRALEDLQPDVGGPALHPTAGACAVGARRVLIACNVNLETQDLAVAKRIARSIRTSSGGLPHVKALGLSLPGRGITQVSMNLTHYEVTPLPVVFSRILELGAKVRSTELIGFVPARALHGADEFLALYESWNSDRILENRIAQLQRG